MQSSSEGSLLEIIDLAHSLRQEQLFISGEQNAFIKLNTSLVENSENVSQLAWICAQQRQNLNNLIISKPETGPSYCCKRANNLENTKFIPAYKAKGLKYQYTLAYTDLFNYLHRSPYLLAQCLAVGDRICRLSPDLINSVVQTIATGLYDNAIHSKDVEMVLKLLQELIEIQIVDSDNPRRMFRTGSCAFSRLYHRLHESLFSAKLFLTACLYEPITKVLIEDEIMLDIDPNKALANYPSKERLKKFGQQGTSEYDEKVRNYTEETIDKLFHLANHFLKSLKLNWSLLPSTLRWLVQSMCHLLKRSQFSDKDINALLTEMIFTNFICSAIVSPDLYGISDVPISENARFNLIQIGQILQMLALMKHEDVDPKMTELYNKFDRNIISDLLELILPNDFDLGISMLTMSPHQNNLGRKNVLVTQNELNILIDFLRNVLENDGLTISGEDRRKLSEILERLPDKWENIISDHQEINNKTARQTLINLQKKTKSKLAKTISLNVSSLENENDLSSGLNNHNNLSNHNNNNNNNNNNNINNNNNNNNNQLYYDDYEQVLIVPISVYEETKFQLLTEEEVLNMNNISNETVEPILTEKNVEELERRTEENETLDGGVGLRSGHQKLARFSLSHDDASIGNTSDNLEVVSEAPSNHSVASSMELEENYQNDNLSDMVSANVSGRGTPNISGRDTPSSQVTEGDNRTPQIPTTQMVKILNKARSDIEDKFCKFEIKKLLEGDETISIISDTWSTDVLASDSETIEANDRGDRNFSTPLIPSAVILPGDNNFDPLSNAGSQLRTQNLDASETQSESAWSTDVLASDSEKMTEIDTDDNQSIAAKSDITDAGRSECEPNRDNELLIRLNRAPDSPMFFTPRIPNIQFRTPDYQSRVTSDISFFNNRNFDEQNHVSLLRHSRHTNLSNSYDGAVGGIPIPQNPQPIDDTNNPFINDRRSFEITTNNSDFQEYDRQSYLQPNQGINLSGTRQNSIESNNSEISSNFDRDDKKIRPFDYRKQTKEYVENTPPVRSYQPFEQEHSERNNNTNSLNSSNNSNNNNNNNRYQFSNFDRILFDTSQSTNNSAIIKQNGQPENIIKTSTNIINPFEDENHLNNYEIIVSPNKLYEDDIRDDLVEHRRISSEQRNASFDGRRNGMIDYQNTRNTTSIITKRLITDYENHQLKTTMHLITTKETTTPILLNNQTDDLLIKQTQNLRLISPNVEENNNHHHQNHNNYSTSLLDIVSIPTPTSNTISSAQTISLSPLTGTITKSGINKSTGAIPKSISFDSSADKINRSGVHSLSGNGNGNNGNIQIRRSETARVHGTGFFNKIKQGFKNRRGNKFRNTLDDTRDFVNGIQINHQIQKNPLDDDHGGGMLITENGFIDTTEDILAKYRRKASSSSDAAASDSTGSNASSSKSKSSQSDTEQRLQNGMMITNDTGFLFNNAKRKLRVVLSSTDLQTTDFHHTRCGTTSPLLIYLQIQLAQALNLQNLQQVSYVSEAIRCVNAMDIIDHQKLLEELQQDLFKRQSYLQYLMRYRQNLLSALESIDRFEDRLQNDREMCNRHLIMVCVRMFLEKREHSILKVVDKFTSLTVVDEKIDYLEECMGELMDELKSDGILQGMADWQLQEARTSIERILLQRLYRQVMFPNDDGDIARDQVLCEHIRKLSRLISPSHTLLRIPQEYLIEAPWPFAQQQIAHISAYKTPKDKVQCVVRCITSIMNLLSMGSNRVPSADDLTPVLIYVVIKANPPYLLSTIEYVNCFIGDKLEGETQYWWTQFCSAVQFIKTMDYVE